MFSRSAWGSSSGTSEDSRSSSRRTELKERAGARGGVSALLYALGFGALARTAMGVEISRRQEATQEHGSLTTTARRQRDVLEATTDHAAVHVVAGAGSTVRRAAILSAARLRPAAVRLVVGGFASSSIGTDVAEEGYETRGISLPSGSANHHAGFGAQARPDILIKVA